MGTHLKIEWFCDSWSLTWVDIAFFIVLVSFCVSVLSHKLSPVTRPIQMLGVFSIHFDIFKVKKVCSKWVINVKNWMHMVLLKYSHLPPWDFCGNSNWYFMYLSFDMKCLPYLNGQRLWLKFNSTLQGAVQMETIWCPLHLRTCIWQMKGRMKKHQGGLCCSVFGAVFVVPSPVWYLPGVH